jgi:hypothetical protein
MVAIQHWMILPTKWSGVFFAIREQIVIILQNGCRFLIRPVALVSSHPSLILLLVLFQGVVRGH